jgi:hypothetical protein
VTTRYNPSGGVASASAMMRRFRAHETAAHLQDGTLKPRFYPTGYASLTQRLVLGRGSYSDDSYERKYFCTIHETEHLARSLQAGG